MVEGPDNRAFFLEELWFSDVLGRKSMQANGCLENPQMTKFLS